MNVRKCFEGRCFARIDWALVLFIFFLIFSPPIVPQINTAIFAAVIAGIFLWVRYRKELLAVIKDSGMGRFAAVMAAFFGYIAVVTAVNIGAGESVQLMHYVKLWYRLLMIVPVLLVCCLFICIRAKERQHTLRELVMHFVWATMIQFLLVFVALVVPQVKQFFVSVIYKNTGDSYLGIPWVMARRGFGFANSFVDSFGFGMGLIAALPLFFIREQRLRSIYLVPCLVLVSFVNVRTGIVVAAIGLLMSLPVLVGDFLAMSGKGKIKMVCTILLALLLLALLIALVCVCNPLTIHWVLGDVLDMLGLDLEAPMPSIPTASPGEGTTVNPGIYSDAQTTTSDVLFSENFWNLPSGWTFLFGSGHTIYGAEGYPHSDVGYVNDLWLGGVIGCVLLYGAFALLIVKAFRASGKLNVKMLVLFLAVSIAVFQIKANAIMFNAGINTIMPLLFYICCCGASEERVCLLEN